MKGSLMTPRSGNSHKNYSRAVARILFIGVKMSNMKGFCGTCTQHTVALCRKDADYTVNTPILSCFSINTAIVI
jgi:hypothetical protein